MPSINIVASRPKLLRKKYIDAMQEALDEVFKEAIRAFLRETVQHVPVDTGMSRGAFLNIGYHFNAGLAPIVPKRYNVKYHTGETKSPELGASLTTNPINVLTPKKLLLRRGIEFSLETKVWQYNFHEPDWQSFTRGLEAFRAVFNDLRGKIPALEKFLVEEVVELKGTKIVKSQRKLKR